MSSKEAIPTLHIDGTELKNQIKQRDFARLYVICGKDAYLKKSAALALAAAVPDKAFADFNFHRFEGKETTQSEIEDAVNALPLGGGKSCVLVRDYPLEKEGKDTEEQAVTEEKPKKGKAGKKESAFLRFLMNLPAHCVLVFWQTGSDFSPAKNKSLAEAVAVYGHIAELNPPGEADVIKSAQLRAKKLGCVFPAETVRYMMEIVGKDTQQVLTETEKLCAYVQSGEIRHEHIDAVCVKCVEALAFDMVKEIVAGNGRKAFALMSDLFAQKLEAPQLLGPIASNYIDAWRVSACMCSGVPYGEVGKLFGYKGNYSYRLDKAAGLAKKLKPQGIRRALDILDAADRMLKSSGADSRYVMEKCLLRLLRVNAPPARAG
ncbi:MAG: DNA polymerase III subunit delta [Oscillospiraceae bacterium]|nr:DNA polymerase III subunit delta [Oscillospiraceae bacterium]